MPYDILVVDDNRLIRGMIVRSVRLSKIALGKLREADSGEAALEILRGGGVDLVLLDLNRPGMGGFEFLRRVRADPALRAVAVLVVTSESSHPAMARLRELDAGWVHKPFKPEERTAAAGALLKPRSTP